MSSFSLRILISVILFIGFKPTLFGQFLMDMIDTTKTKGKQLLSILDKYENIKIGGYMQPQFQWAQSKGIGAYNGGKFASDASNRFMLRRGRIRFDYYKFNPDNQPSINFVFQFDGTERGVAIRDFWGRLYEHKLNMFGVTFGMFARPFGFEVNYSSQVRETPERGRMSQILMKTERDLGVMIQFKDRRVGSKLKYIGWDVGVFNGQGLAGVRDFDNFKDVISRLYVTPVKISNQWKVSGGLSLLYGGLLQKNKQAYIYDPERSGFMPDSIQHFSGSKAPRHYFGGDVQFSLKSNLGTTVFRSEYWWGTQTGFANETDTPSELLDDPYFIRKFDGAFFYLLHTFGGKHQLGVKYDWYDPNREVKGTAIGRSGSQTAKGDIQFSTWSIGYNYYFMPEAKLVIWYEIPRNESTSIAGFERDVKDNILTCRVQFTF